MNILDEHFEHFEGSNFVVIFILGLRLEFDKDYGIYESISIGGGAGS